ncbi:hypothetical protein TNIN_65781 [Trichonephila inaurata madagascariensis]|uniref:Uncharacterized protein n=1 Tax=Trichonephila inaurata madagascariensis TaxID=2747483 RepID=A0A8X6X539_9ARAC|nr:hypothetical protein TNIN_65781 [Trichonephila inaurata madagascariensis]
MAVKGKRWCSVVIWVEVYGWDLKKVFLSLLRSNPIASKHAFAIFDGSSNDTAVASKSGAWGMPTSAELVAVDYLNRFPPPA